jgi:hypothetical protein
VSNWDSLQRTGSKLLADAGTTIFVSSAQQQQQQQQQFGEPSNVAETFAQKAGGGPTLASLPLTNPASAAAPADGRFVHAHLQTVSLPGSDVVHIIHWHHVSSAASAIAAGIVTAGLGVASAHSEDEGGGDGGADDAASAAAAAGGDGDGAPGTARSTAVASARSGSGQSARRRGGNSSPALLEIGGADEIKSAPSATAAAADMLVLAAASAAPALDVSTHLADAAAPAHDSRIVAAQQQQQQRPGFSSRKEPAPAPISRRGQTPGASARRGVLKQPNPLRHESREDLFAAATAAAAAAVAAAASSESSESALVASAANPAMQQQGGLSERKRPTTGGNVVQRQVSRGSAAVVGVKGAGGTKGAAAGGEVQERGSYASSRNTHGARLQDRVRRVLSFGVGNLMPDLTLLKVVGSLLFIAILVLSIAMVRYACACAWSFKSCQHGPSTHTNFFFSLTQAGHLRVRGD